MSKQFKLSLWPNNQKRGDTSPDATGSLQIPVATLKEIVEAFKSGETPITQDYKTKEDCISIRASAWRNEQRHDRDPVINIQIDTPTETREKLAAKAKRDAERNGQNSQQADNDWVPF